MPHVRSQVRFESITLSIHCTEASSRSLPHLGVQMALLRYYYLGTRSATAGSTTVALPLRRFNRLSTVTILGLSTGRRYSCPAADGK